MRKVLYNGKFYLERGSFAQAILIEADRIQAVGLNEEILSHADVDERIDCRGRTVLPGMNDSHMHLLMMGVNLSQVRISQCTSIHEIVEICKEFIAENPETRQTGLLGMGWNQESFTSGEIRLPNRHDLDRISTEIPILLYRICGHVAVANTAAIQKSGLTGDSPQYEGGYFGIGEDGYPDGIFSEFACDAVRGIFPKPSAEFCRKSLVKAMRHLVSLGVTSVQACDAGNFYVTTWEGLALFLALYANGDGLLRYHHQLVFDSPEEFAAFIESGDYRNGRYEMANWLTLGPLKLFKDGSLGGRTAMLRDGYKDAPGNCGIEAATQDAMLQYARLAAEAGIPLATHAIGDGAIEKTLDVYETVLKNGTNALRHSLIHCQITDRPLLERIARLGILVQYQPVFLESDIDIAESRVGKDLASTSYAFRTAVEYGVPVSFGTDSPIEDCNPFGCIFHAVTRQDRGGKHAEPFFLAECVDVETAVDAYTIGSAYCQRMEAFKGRIREGYLADLVVLDRDIFTVPAEAIKDILPVMTMIGGEVVFERTI